MNSPERIGIAALLSRPYKFIRLEWSVELSALRVRTCVKPIQCYSLGAMAELQRVLLDIAENPGLVKHFVMTSDVPGVFNFGGDLSLFVLLIRARDHESLRLYGRRCVDLLWWMETAAQMGVHTTVLVQGDTLGGGLESVMPFHKVIFERSAQAGFPEVLFNLVPGHGCLELHDPQGRLRGRQRDDPVGQALHGRAVVCQPPDRRRRRRWPWRGSDRRRPARGASALAWNPFPPCRPEASPAPVTYQSLMDIVDRWTENSLNLTDRDLKLMERLARAQIRKGTPGVTDGAVEELKRVELDKAWGEERTGITEWASL